MIFITGGSGFVGRHLIKRLTDAGHGVRCLVRRQAAVESMAAAGAEAVLGDVTDSARVTEAMRGAESVVHLIAILRESRGATFEAINVQGTKNIVAAAQQAGVKKFVHIGALGATADPEYGYPYSKWQGAEAVRTSGLDFTVLEPSVFFGPGAGFIEMLLGTLKMMPLVAPIAGSGRNLFQPLWVEDVVSCIIKSLQGDKSRQTCEIGGPEHLSYEQVFDAVMAARGIKRLKIHLPLPLMRPAVAVMERLLTNPPVTSGELKSLKRDNITDLDAVEKQFGFKPLPLSQGLGYLRPSSP